MAYKDFFHKTRAIFLWSRLLNTPFWTIYNMLVIILYKEFHATPLQVTAMIVIKPLASLFSPYWSTWIEKRQDRLVSNIVWANIVKYVPFLLFPLFQNVWLFIFSFGFYMVFLRAVTPAWMEIIKQNIQGESRERVFAIGSTIDYLGGVILPITFGWVLDDYVGSWRWIFFLTALVGILSTLLLIYIPVKVEKFQERTSFTFSHSLVKPWKSAWNLLRERPDFGHFQIGFMLGASALMMIHTVLPQFFVDVLAFSYTEIMFAIALCKGIGFAASSPFWVKIFQRIDIYTFCSLVTLCAALFPVFLFSGYFFMAGPYIAYIIYGTMQAGSELSWNLSGPYFARDSDSAAFSNVNLLTIGIRGCFAPVMGTLLCSMTNASTVMAIAFLLCMIATERMRHYGKEYSSQKVLVH